MIDTSKAEAHVQSVLSTITEESYETEHKWENAMIERGRQKYLRLINQAKENKVEATTDYGMILIKRSLDAVIAGLHAYINKYGKGRAGKMPSAYKYLRNMDLDVAAFIALRRIFDAGSLDTPLQNIALSIGNELMFECKLRALKEQDAPRWSTTQSYLRHTSSRKYKATVLNFALGKSDCVTFQVWPKLDRFQLGMRMIDIIHDTTGLIDIYSEWNEGKKNGFYKISFTHETTKWISKFCSHSELANPDYYPTLIPPRPWTNAFEGGYWFNAPGYVKPILKVRDKEYMAAVDALMKSGHLEEVRQAVNALQNTAWTVNKQVLEVAEAIWNGGGDKAGLPKHDDLHLPFCPVCGADITEEANAHVKHPCLEELKQSDPDAFKAWKMSAKRIRNLNAMIQGQRIGVAKTLAMARTMKKHDRFYYPYQLDFRSRIYTIPSYLTPQGTDLAKALLKFADAKPLGSMDAVKWLAVQLANTYGNDKISLDDRYSWVIQNQQKILSVAEDPYENDFWMDADEPFCFLAACFEWAGYVREGLDYKSSLPIAMDGSCNGLQLFSLILHDEVGGEAVNLTKTDKPHDIYGIVAEKVIEHLKRDASDPSLDRDVTSSTGKMTFNKYRDAKVLLELPINRKTTKRQVMTLPYGSTMQSCIEYTREWMKDHGEWNDRHEFLRISTVLARYIWEAIGETVIKARQAMDYLQKMASCMNRIGKPIYWETPCGLPIKQAYQDYKTSRIETMLGESVVRMWVSDDEISKLNPHKQKNSISPNFIHSFDASALMKTVCGCTNEDIFSFAMIHDSYGTHAADSTKLARILRESFILMFCNGNDILKDFEERLIKQYPELLDQELPARPEFGTLDVEEVRNSLFFFA